MTVRIESTGSSPAGVLLATADADLLEALLRLTAGVGVEAQVAAHAGGVRPGWQDTSLVLVGADLAAGVAAVHLPRRDDVLVVGTTGDAADTGLWRAAVDLGAEAVLLLPDAEAALVSRLAGSERADAHGVVVAVVGGRGGAGASVLASALAVAGTRTGRSVLLVDADPWGGGADLLLGGEGLAGLRWSDLVGLTGSLNGSALAAALPHPHGVAVVAWDRGAPVRVPASAVAAVLDASVRAHDLVVVDLPRQADEVAAAVLSRARTTLLVVPAEVRAAVAAGQTLGWLAPGAGTRLVVRAGRGRGVEPEAVAAALALPLAAVIPEDRRLAAALDAGEPPGIGRRSALARVAEALVDEVCGERPGAAA